MVGQDGGGSIDIVLLVGGNGREETDLISRFVGALALG